MKEPSAEALATWAVRQYGAHAPVYLRNRASAAESSGARAEAQTWRRADEICRRDALRTE